MKTFYLYSIIFYKCHSFKAVCVFIFTIDSLFVILNEISPSCLTLVIILLFKCSRFLIGNIVLRGCQQNESHILRKIIRTINHIHIIIYGTNN